MSDSTAAARWAEIKSSVEADLRAYSTSLSEKEKALAMRAAELSVQIGVERLMGKDTSLAEEALAGAYLAIQSSTIQMAALVAVKSARDALRKTIGFAFSLIAGL